MAVKKSSTPAELLDQIYTQRREAPLSILGLAEPILAPNVVSQARQSDSSEAASNGQESLPTPSSLSADLTHYRDLFSKLRFSYLEQVTKEKYLRGIVGEPPILATSEQNAQLEEKLAIMKAELQQKKTDVEQLVIEMEELARSIADKYDGVNLAMQQLETLPDEVKTLEADVEELERQLAEKEAGREISDDPRMNMSMADTIHLIEEQKRKNQELRRQVEDLQTELPQKTAQSEDIEKELKDLQKRRNEITRAAREMQRRKEKGGRDTLEEQGRWYQSSEVVLKGLLGV